jgi:hypothetical protein
LLLMGNFQYLSAQQTEFLLSIHPASAVGSLAGRRLVSAADLGFQA